MINFNGKMLKLQDLADKMLTLQSDIVAGKMLKLYGPTGKILMITKLWMIQSPTNLWHDLSI